MGTYDKHIHCADTPRKRRRYNHEVPPKCKPFQTSDKWPEEAEKRKFDRKYGRPQHCLISKKKFDAVRNLIEKVRGY